MEPLDGDGVYLCFLFRSFGFFLLFVSASSDSRRCCLACLLYLSSPNGFDEDDGDYSNFQVMSVVLFIYSANSTWSSIFFRIIFSSSHTKRGESRASWVKVSRYEDDFVQRLRSLSSTLYKPFAAVSVDTPSIEKHDVFLNPVFGFSNPT